MIERGGEFDTPARDPGMLRLRGQHGVFRHFVGCPAHNHVACAHSAGRDCGLRLGAAFHQSAFDEKPVDPHAGRHDYRKQAIAIGLSEARRKGKKVPKRKGRKSSRKGGRKKSKR